MGPERYGRPGMEICAGGVEVEWNPGFRGCVCRSPAVHVCDQIVCSLVLYDSLGSTYAASRKPDPRISASLHRALSASGLIVNVGAGTGSYEPSGRDVIAIEPSAVMINQRSARKAPAIQAKAEQLPLRDACASASMAILTVHHWSSLERGLEEMIRVARERIVLLTWDPAGPDFWLTMDYFPALVERDRRRFPALDTLRRILGRTVVKDVPVPWDCVDGFLGAYWRRPERYLDPVARSGMSGFSELIGLEDGVKRLKSDLESGLWNQRYERLGMMESIDLGYRLVIAETH